MVTSSVPMLLRVRGKRADGKPRRTSRPGSPVDPVASGVTLCFNDSPETTLEAVLRVQKG
ncbi:hypothetical protein GCM10022275_31800 [Tessaracoccus defluvii]